MKPNVKPNGGLSKSVLELKPSIVTNQELEVTMPTLLGLLSVQRSCNGPKARAQSPIFKAWLIPNKNLSYRSLISSDKIIQIVTRKVKSIIIFGVIRMRQSVSKNLGKLEHRQLLQ